jgi:hypothetical protein
LLILEVRGVVVDIGYERVLLFLLEVRGDSPTSTTTPSHLQYQQQPTLTSNINNNQLSPPISTATPSHLQYQQQPPLTSNINNNPLSPPI